MSTQHTPGRLRLFQVGDNLEFLCPATEDGESILTITHEGNTAFAVVLSDMNARRLVACWNACDGISTELLEAAPYKDSAAFMAFLKVEGQRDELLDSIKNFFDVYENREKKPGWVVRIHDARARCMEAIDKATGSAV